MLLFIHIDHPIKPEMYRERSMEATTTHERRRRRRKDDSLKLHHSYSGKGFPVTAAPERVQIVGPRRSHEGVLIRRRDQQGEVLLLEGRKSVSHVETINQVQSVAAFLRVKVVAADMPEFMQVHAFRCARRTYDTLEIKSSHKHIAYTIKKEFDRVYGRAWHCIVGSSFGSFVTHSTGCFLYFSMEKIFVLVFKTKVVPDDQ